jgi:hypothetical protein
VISPIASFGRRPWLLLALLLGLGAGHAQLPVRPEASASAASVSGQFIVHGGPAPIIFPGRELRPAGEATLIGLRPDLLAVTCERVKKAVLQRLDQRDQWRGKVHLHLQPQGAAGGQVTIRPQVFRDGWQFQVAVPEPIEWHRLVRSLTEVVLLEMANRENLSVVCAQPPLWLTEGMNQLLVGDYGRDLVIESQTSLVRSERKPDPLKESRTQLRGREPLGFSALTLVTAEQAAGLESFPRFQASSALLVHLLTDETRRARTGQFLAQLPASLNWQTTFLALNRAEFATLLEAEKWWAVNAAHELTAAPNQFWTPAAVTARLADIFTETAAVRTPDGMVENPDRVALSRVVLEWDWPTQALVLQRKVAQLQLLLLRTPERPAPLRRLVGESLRTLERYLSERQRAGTAAANRGETSDRARVLAKGTARRLAALEVRRGEMAR